MGAMASQITSLTIVYSTVYSDADQRKHQSSASVAFVRGVHRGPVNSPHKWPVTRKMFPFDDVITSPYESICYLGCCLFGVKSSFLNQYLHNINWKLWNKIQWILDQSKRLFKKCVSKCRLQNGDHFVLVPIRSLIHLCKFLNSKYDYNKTEAFIMAHEIWSLCYCAFL